LKELWSRTPQVSMQTLEKDDEKKKLCKRGGGSQLGRGNFHLQQNRGWSRKNKKPDRKGEKKGFREKTSAFFRGERF